MRVGIAEIDISPKAGINVGPNSNLSARYILDPLKAKALVLEDGENKLCLITADLIVISKVFSAKIRRTASKKFGFSEEAIMTHALQIHSAPSLGNFVLSDDFSLPQEYSWLRGGEEKYNSYAFCKIIEVIEKANSNLEEIKVGVGSGVEGRVAFNRRMVMRDGLVAMPWFGVSIDGRSRFLEGPIDPELGVICFRTDSLHFKSILLNYTCHPVNLHPEFRFQKVVSADWPGALSREIRSIFGNSCIPIVTNGTCGNVNPWDPYDENFTVDHDRMGSMLAKTTQKVVESLDYVDNPILDYKSKNIKIKFMKYSAEEIEKAGRFLNKYPVPDMSKADKWGTPLDWVSAATLIDRYKKSQIIPEDNYEIQVFKLGEAAFVGLPGEPFVEVGLEIKLRSPTYPTYVIHNTRFGGYIPTRNAFKHGGYEVSKRVRFMVPEASEIIVDAAVDLLNEIF
jgi:hypothetical protein